jgi:hypothetical protein
MEEGRLKWPTKEIFPTKNEDSELSDDVGNKQLVNPSISELGDEDSVLMQQQPKKGRKLTRKNSRTVRDNSIQG